MSIIKSANSVQPGVCNILARSLPRPQSRHPRPGEHRQPDTTDQVSTDNQTQQTRWVQTTRHNGPDEQWTVNIYRQPDTDGQSVGHPIPHQTPKTRWAQAIRQPRPTNKTFLGKIVSVHILLWSNVIKRNFSSSARLLLAPLFSIKPLVLNMQGKLFSTY